MMSVKRTISSTLGSVCGRISSSFSTSSDLVVSSSTQSEPSTSFNNRKGSSSHSFLCCLRVYRSRLKMAKPSVFHVLVVIFLEFFAWGLLTSPMITVSNHLCLYERSELTFTGNRPWTKPSLIRHSWWMDWSWDSRGSCPFCRPLWLEH